MRVLSFTVCTYMVSIAYSCGPAGLISVLLSIVEHPDASPARWRDLVVCGLLSRHPPKIIRHRLHFFCPRKSNSASTCQHFQESDYYHYARCLQKAEPLTRIEFNLFASSSALITSRFGSPAAAPFFFLCLGFLPCGDFGCPEILLIMATG